jgi:hypothetical protein
LAIPAQSFIYKRKEGEEKRKREKESERENNGNQQCHTEMTLPIFLISYLSTRFILHTGRTWIIFTATAGFAPLSITNIPTGTRTTLEAFHSIVAPHAYNTWSSDTAGSRNLRSEVPTAVNIKITVFWDVIPRGLVGDKFFGVTYCHHL